MTAHWRELGTLGRIEAIRSVWFPGCSTSQIAANFHDVTRNAIIGIYNRYGRSHLSDKPLTARSPINKAGVEKKQRRIVRAPANFKPAALFKLIPEPVKVATETNLCGKPLMMLQARECRWPVNDPEPMGIHLFCGLDADGAYCAHHRSRAYRPADTRQRAPR